jgi:hypothetical protein
MSIRSVSRFSGKSAALKLQKLQLDQNGNPIVEHIVHSTYRSVVHWRRQSKFAIAMIRQAHGGRP